MLIFSFKTCLTRSHSHKRCLIVSSFWVQTVHFGSPFSFIMCNKVFVTKNFMIYSALEPFYCTLKDFKNAKNEYFFWHPEHFLSSLTGKIGW